MNNQKILIINENYIEIEDFLKNASIRKFMLVCDSIFPYLQVSHFFEKLTLRTGIEFIIFNEFTPNPQYESVVKGVELFNKEKCQAIIAIGGGSTIDVAKCIKLYSNMNMSGMYLEQKIVPNDVQLYAMPTTAGTGSEATRYAVIYYKGEKQSISDLSCIPSVVFFDVSVLGTLPIYQKKATMMDAFCHAIESFWSINSNDLSQKYSAEAIKLILENKDFYLENKEIGNINMFKAAYIAGKAINITQTTAGHAMCYKLTSLYGIAHGHAAAICVKEIFRYMTENVSKCIDPRGEEYLYKIFVKIAKTMGGATASDAVNKFSRIVDGLELPLPNPNKEDYFVLKKSVNLQRLKNNPISLDESAIDMLYHLILERKK